MSKSLYSILQIDESATADDVKKSFKKLAMETHPDRGGNKEQFQEIQNAYEVLGDPEKRRQYDAQSNAHNFTFDLFNVFNNVNIGKEKKNDIHHILNVTLLEIYTGTLKKIKIKRNIHCTECSTVCGHCNGNGHVTHHFQHGPFIQKSQIQCNKCSCTGKLYLKEYDCKKCNKKNHIVEEKIVELSIQKGLESNKQFIIESWGEEALNGNQMSGNLIITINVVKDENFVRQGMDLLYVQTISLKDSIVGRTITIPHFEEALTIETNGFGVINPKKQYTIFGKGMTSAGNLHIQFEIIYPDVHLSNESMHILGDAFTKVNL